MSAAAYIDNCCNCNSSWTLETIILQAFTPSFKAFYDCCCANGGSGPCGSCPSFDATEHTNTITSMWATLMAYDFDSPPSSWQGTVNKAMTHGYYGCNSGTADSLWCPGPGGSGFDCFPTLSSTLGENSVPNKFTWLAGCDITGGPFCDFALGGKITMARVRITGPSNVCVSRRTGSWSNITVDSGSLYTVSNCASVAPDGSNHIYLPRAGFDPTGAVAAFMATPGGGGAVYDWPWINLDPSWTLPGVPWPCEDCACP